MRVFLCILVAGFVFQASAANLPSFIKACSKSDPKLNQCIEKAIEIAGPRFADGIPEIGIKPLDPVELGTIKIDSSALKLIFTDTVVTGLRGFRVNSFKMNHEKGKAVLDFTANVTLKAHYDMDGQVLILPIRGNGQAKIKITNLNIVIKYDFETKDGHWNVLGYRDNYKMDHAQFKFSNLFGGNKELGDVTNRFANENWQLIMNDIAPPAIKAVIEHCVSVVKGFFASVPANELLLE